jgi:hypothetical protein
MASWWNHRDGCDDLRRGARLNRRGFLQIGMLGAGGLSLAELLHFEAQAGGGIQGGRAIGESDAHGAFPRANPKTPQGVLATLYRHLGIDTEKQYVNAAGRPISVLPSGSPIDELF